MFKSIAISRALSSSARNVRNFAIETQVSLKRDWYEKINRIEKVLHPEILPTVEKKIKHLIRTVHII